MSFWERFRWHHTKLARGARGFTRASQPWRATHRHRKGGEYRVLSYGLLEADRTEAVIYDDEDGQIWVRSKSEFNDGRFVKIVDNVA